MREDVPVEKKDILEDLINNILIGEYDYHTLGQVIELIYVKRDAKPLLLLFNGNETAQLNAMYILSEIGGVSRELISKIVEFTCHSHWQARFWTLSCILAGAEPDDGGALAAGIRLLTDQDERVRSKALDFLSRLSSAKIVAARDALATCEDGNVFVESLTRLLGYSADSIDQILADAKSEDWLRRATAMAFAGRAARTGRKISTKGSRSFDPVTSEFAKEFL
jgi:hypothetical protein